VKCCQARRCSAEGLCSHWPKDHTILSWIALAAGTAVRVCVHLKPICTHSYVYHPYCVSIYFTNNHAIFSHFSLFSFSISFRLISPLTIFALPSHFHQHCLFLRQWSLVRLLQFHQSSTSL
jgi:hypothetical protein